ncbi:MAG TPA: hypothetical protein VFJ17_08505 [Mycobacteriales bacterium]|jgi:hypothetical protein|nr:hypothetical protein [Mycobacteriales bacterium]
MPTDLLAELIADAQQIVLPRPRVMELPRARMPVDEIVIPESTVSLVDGYTDYGS